jgi:hypothetical protein
MKLRIVMVTGLVLAWAGAALAQQSGSRIDLGRFAEEPSGHVSVRATFEEGSVVCPEDRTLISAGPIVRRWTSVALFVLSWTR